MTLVFVDSKTNQIGNPTYINPVHTDFKHKRLIKKKIEIGGGRVRLLSFCCYFSTLLSS